MADENIGSWWSTLIGSRQGQTGKLQRLASPPPAPVEDWPRAQKFGGELTPIYVLRSVASSSWDVQVGYQRQPKELANYLIRCGHARLAKADQVTPSEEQ